MSELPGRSPLHDAATLIATLVEQGLTADEAAETADALLPLQLWRAPQPDPLLVASLVARLQGNMATRRRALRTAAPPGPLEQILALVKLARLQVHVLRPAFWLSAAAIVALGGALLALRPDAPRMLLLYLLGPLVAYLSVATAFQGASLGLLECELACPPPARQFVVARLTVVLTYLLGLGVCLSLALAWQDAGLLTLTWLAPLLVEVGLTLLLSTRLTVERAAAVVYTLWATFLGLTWGVGLLPDGPLLSLNLLLGTLGLGAIAVAVYVTPRLLDRRLGLRPTAT